VIRTVLLCFALVLVAGAVIVGRARGQDGHAQHHDAYKGLSNPTTGVSCCNDGDCRPGAVWRDDAGTLRARIAGREMSVPETALLPGEMNPHRPVGMICEKDGHFYCVAFSGAGG
jgi:hypothetical protein